MRASQHSARHEWANADRNCVRSAARQKRRGAGIRPTIRAPRSKSRFPCRPWLARNCLLRSKNNYPPTANVDENGNVPPNTSCKACSNAVAAAMPTTARRSAGQRAKGSRSTLTIVALERTLIGSAASGSAKTNRSAPICSNAPCGTTYKSCCETPTYCGKNTSDGCKLRTKTPRVVNRSGSKSGPRRAQ
jgi:hypothetical protein